MKPCLSNFQRGGLFVSLIISLSAPLLGQQSSAPASIQPLQSPNPTPTTAPARTATDLSSPTPGVSNVSQNYIITPGDTLDIAIYDAPDLSEKATVTSRGDLYLPLVKIVHVAGMTLEAAQTQIETAYQQGGFLKEPLIRVAVAEFAQGVDIIGEVVKPGTYPVAGEKRFFDLLSEAGGTTALAGPFATIRRASDGHLETVSLSSNANELLKSDVWVHQGDTVIVVKAGVIYVVGEVLQPAGFVMQDRTDYTVLKAVAMAHGTTKSAKLSQVAIVRKSPTGVTQIPISLDKIMASKSPDVPLQPDDIVFVPTNKAKNAALKAGEVALGLASGATLILLTRQ